MVDPDRVRRLLGAVERFADELSRLVAQPVDEYVARDAYAGRYLVQAAAQACIDVANHLIASEGWRVPGSFREAFDVLEEEDVIDAELAERLRGLTGLRNRLVHLYEDVDDRLVHAAAAAGLDDLRGFASRVARLVADNADDKGS